MSFKNSIIHPTRLTVFCRRRALRFETNTNNSREPRDPRKIARVKSSCGSRFKFFPGPKMFRFRIFGTGPKRVRGTISQSDEWFLQQNRNLPILIDNNLHWRKFKAVFLRRGRPLLYAFINQDSKSVNFNESS